MAAQFRTTLNTQEYRQNFRSSSQTLLMATNQEKDSLRLEFAKKFLSHMYDLWRNDQLCDVRLECNGGRLNAHKVALGTYSEKLAKNFIQYAPNEMLTIDLKEFSREAMHVVLVFVYTTELNLSEGNVGDVLGCALELEITYIKDACIIFLNDHVSVLTVFEYLEVASRHRLAEFLERLERFLIQHLGEVIATDGFLRISRERLHRLLTSHRDARVVGELAVLLAVVRWVDHCRPEREPLAPALLRLINFHLISPTDLINRVEKISLITNNMETFLMLYSAMSYHALRATRSDVLIDGARNFNETSPADWTRRFGSIPYLGSVARVHNEQQMSQFSYTQTAPAPSAPPSVISNSPPQRVIKFNTQASTMIPPTFVSPPTPTIIEPEYSMTPLHGRTHPVPPPPPPPAPPTVRPPTPPPTTVVLPPTPTQQLTGALPSYNNQTFTTYAHFVPTGTSNGALVVVAVGGIEMETSSVETPGRCVYTFEPQNSGMWRSLATLPSNTHHHGVAMVNDKLYVVGGASYTPNPEGDLGVAMSTVHMFDLRTRLWSEVANLQKARSYLSVSADDTYLYAIGGEDDNRNRLDSIERYDSRFNRWQHLTNIPSGPKVGAASCVYNGKLYVVGGYNSRRGGGLPVMGDVECYDLRTHSWTALRALPEPRCHAGLVVAEGRMFLIGGRTKSMADGVNSLGSILCYDEVRDVWLHVANLHTPRHDAGCVAIGSRVYIVGGIRSPSPSCLASVECWDCVSGEWNHPVPNLPYTAAGLGCCSARV